MADPAGSRADLTPAPPGEAAPTDTWWFAALSSELKPGKLQRYDLLGDPVLLGRTRQGGLYALRDICPHRAAPFSAGRLVDDEGPNGVEPRVECPYHGWRFGLDGACRVIPSLVDNTELDPARIRVRTYPVREQQGLVWIWNASNPRADPDPDHEPPLIEGSLSGEPKLIQQLVLDQPVEAMVADFARGLAEPGAAARLPHAGLRWEGGRGRRGPTMLACLTPLDAHRTRLTRISWTALPALTRLSAALRLGARS